MGLVKKYLEEMKEQAAPLAAMAKRVMAGEKVPRDEIDAVIADYKTKTEE